MASPWWCYACGDDHLDVQLRREHHVTCAHQGAGRPLPATIPAFGSSVPIVRTKKEIKLEASVAPERWRQVAKNECDEDCVQTSILMHILCLYFFAVQPSNDSG